MENALSGNVPVIRANRHLEGKFSFGPLEGGYRFNFDTDIMEIRDKSALVEVVFAHFSRVISAPYLYRAIYASTPGARLPFTNVSDVNPQNFPLKDGDASL